MNFENIIIEGKRSKYNFDLYNINYEKALIEKEHKKNKTFDYSRMQKEGIKLESQVLKYNKVVEFTDVLENKIIEKQFEINEETYTVDEVVDKIYDEFQLREWEGITLKLGSEKYTKNNLPPRDEIKKIVLNSMKKVGIDGELLTIKNRNSILKAFNTLLRQNGKTVEYINIEKDLEIVKTNVMASQSTNILNLKRGETTIFHTNEWKQEVDNKNLIVFEKVLDDGTMPRQSTHEVNINNFKTPVDLVIVNGSPERKFVSQLIENNNANIIDSWIKSRDKNFYSIDYTWRKNGHQMSNSAFNPDFFIKLTEDGIDTIVVVEIKDDGDDSDENKAKYRYALDHFENLNEKLENSVANFFNFS